ncbi:MAG: LysR family transcriptional regulator [Cyanothece sp. SIO1E1]|nr:LysR family transcriptional regulator [Cyanothece sp. SIO1E1]
MKDDRLSGLTAFVQVVRAGGFRRAATELGMSAASVSEAVRRLEDRIGVRLLERTTRSISLTDAGRDFYDRCGSAVDSIAEAIDDIRNAQIGVAGTLRLTAPWVAGPIFLNKLVATFLRTYPHAAVDLVYDDRKLDWVSSGMDAAIRSNSLLEQDAQAIPIGPELPMCVVASADYLARMGTPQSPQDLNTHDGIFFRVTTTNTLAPWTFVEQDQRYTITPRQRFTVNDASTALEMAELGFGLTYTYHAFASAKIQAGRLIALFLAVADVQPGFFISFSSKRHMPPKLREFITLSKEIIRVEGGFEGHTGKQ